MNPGGEAADQMVRDSMQVMEAGAKIAGAGVQGAAAIVAGLARDNPKLRGRTRLNRLLKEGKPLKVFPLKEEQLAKFQKLAKTYGVLFAAVKNKTLPGELDILAKAEDVGKLNRIFERMGYPVPEKEDKGRKKGRSRSPLGNASMLRESGVNPTRRKTARTTGDKASVRAALTRIKTEMAQEKAARDAAAEHARPAPEPQKEERG